MFGFWGSCGVNTVEGCLRPQEQFILCSLHSLLTTKASQAFTCNSWAVQGCGTNLGNAEKQCKVAKDLFPEIPRLLWRCLQQEINNQLQPQGGSWAMIKPGCSHRGADMPWQGQRGDVVVAGQPEPG